MWFVHFCRTADDDVVDVGLEKNLMDLRSCALSICDMASRNYGSWFSRLLLRGSLREFVCSRMSSRLTASMKEPQPGVCSI